MHVLLLAALLLLALPAAAADINQSSWSETDASNNAAPPTGWPAGMAPNQVEPTARAMMGAIKRWYNHMNASVTSGGSVNAQTLTYSIAPTSLAVGDTFRFTVGLTNIAASTVNINGLGAKAVQRQGVDLQPGELLAGSIAEIVYDGTNFQINPTAQPIASHGFAVNNLGDVRLSKAFPSLVLDDTNLSIINSGLFRLTSAGDGTYQFQFNSGIGGDFAMASVPLALSSAGILVSGRAQIFPVSAASLPLCNSASDGSLATVSDNAQTGYGASVNGGGTHHELVYCNGTQWRVH